MKQLRTSTLKLWRHFTR